ncbi:MAG: demethoxyubiquinone hydroxylase family protein, partial [Pseudomonadota bacterium]|nr:demethoxyubiquinone hydroxylase family protein [Pseudomonadota bacterium]
MEKTNKKTLEEIIRVDHAGERGAIKIYEGQLLALKTFKQNASLKRKIEEMKEHERE